MKNSLFLVLVLLVLFTGVAQAARPVKFTFPDVQIGEVLVEIEATSKKDFTTCRYFGDDYTSYLGAYDEAVGPLTEAQTLAFCVENFS